MGSEMCIRDSPNPDPDPNPDPNPDPDPNPNPNPNPGPKPKTNSPDASNESSVSNQDDGLYPILLGIPIVGGLVALLFVVVLILLKRKK